MKSLKNIFLGAFIGITLFSSVAFTNNYFEISKNLDIFTTLFKELNTYYVDDVDPNDLMREGIDAMLQSLDPYTNFISESEIEGYRLQTTGKYGGIGAIIRQKDGQVIVAEPYSGFPADKAGLIAGDKLLEVAGKSTEGKNTEEVSKILKGQPGTLVTVKVARLQADGTEKEFELDLNREEIKIKNVPFHGMVEDGIGYIRLAHFTEKAGKEVREALSELQEEQELKGVVLDLRGNPGGLLNEAVNVSNVFINKGEEIVSTKGKNEDWNKTFKTLNMPVSTDLKVAVLTNKGSASASEIVSGSLQDLDRGVIVGTQTFGKGLVQSTRPLSYNTKLKVTTAKYYIPSGRCIQALDYSHKDEDGKAAKMPDSLRTAYTTKGGRTVFDGVGIDPDIESEPVKLSKISQTLLSESLIFDFATVFRSKNEQIAQPSDFELTDDIFNDFVKFIGTKEYDYSTRSEKLLDQFAEAAENEKYLEAVQSELDALKDKMISDKANDINKAKKELKELLAEELVERYYYREGRLEHSFKYDPELKKAVELLNDEPAYQALLAPN